MYNVVVNGVVNHYNGDNYMAALAVYNKYVGLSKTNESVMHVHLLLSGHAIHSYVRPALQKN